jgi:hypothetical protein
MNPKIQLRLFALGLTVLLSACASSGVMHRDNGQFFISKADARIGSGPSTSLRKEAMDEARDHCAKEGKVFEQVKLDENDAGPGRPAALSLTFKCNPRK